MAGTAADGTSHDIPIDLVSYETDSGIAVFIPEPFPMPQPILTILDVPRRVDWMATGRYN